MKKRHTEEQIIRALKRQEAGEATKKICRELGIHETTFYNWKQKYGGMELSEAKRLRAMEEENRRLKRIVADQALDIQMLKDVNSKKW
jgi:putative transposase